MNNKKEGIDIKKIESGPILDCLDFEIFIISEDFKILFANKAFLKKFGIKEGDALGQYCYKISHHFDSPCKPPHDPCPVEGVKRTKTPAVEVHTHFNKDNKEFLENVIAVPINESGEEIQFLHISIPAEEKDRKKLIANTKEALNKTSDIIKAINLYQQQMKEIQEKAKYLEKTKKELEEKLKELEIINQVAVGRELKMIELKKEIENLEKRFSK